MTRRRLRLAVLISGGGRTLMNLHDRIEAGVLDARIAVVVSSRGDVRGVSRARELGLDTTVVDRWKCSASEYQEKISHVIGDVDLVCLTGFLSLLHIPDEMLGRVINIHPALLPKFGGPGMYGRRVHEAVLASGDTESGCTVHFCDNEYDHGPIILQRTVPVHENDSRDELAARVFEQECIAYPEAIQLFAEERIKLEAGSVTIDWSKQSA